MSIKNRDLSDVDGIQDPQVPNWAELELAQTWADQINFSRPSGWWQLFRAIKGPPQRVQVDSADALFTNIPKYALQEFHNLPNGNYSSRISRGYIKGFDVSMLGVVSRFRQAMAAQVANCRAVLDVGTAGGTLAFEVQRAGVADVWGVDVSPYLLKHAATDYPEIRFVQAPAENLPFADQRFDAIVLCFLLHEMPPKYVRQALAEFHRVLAPGGKLLIAEPSPAQLLPIAWGSLLSAAGWRHLYFKTLARFVYEPFVAPWHKEDKTALFNAAGFTICKHEDRIPINFFELQKTPADHTD
ncbi:class I SAM-dependent methyltransferase [Gilvimarinus polysaccharolyticus]|uniref:class I SAM-dependent methyltransferase n=1 Tax=Gilvimarinus polysaccharolyticus TaxID=863921 RepID=UPI000673386E|nr:class I SAM-dependent methyltransferase [Gilvimarinus polysaccharolyticus]